MFSDIILKKSEISHTNSGIRGQEKMPTFAPNNVIFGCYNQYARESGVLPNLGGGVLPNLKGGVLPNCKVA